MRINKYLAQCNIASRRKVEEYIKNKMIKVNDIVVTDLSTKVCKDDIVKFNDVIVKPSDVKLYYMLNKPKGYVTTVSDDRGRPTVLNLIKETSEHLFPVGRLDMDTEGMLIITNDGDFANQLIHPSKVVDKVYRVIIDSKPTTVQIDKLKSGVKIEENFVTSPCQINNIKKLDNNNFQLDITIHEGKNRQVRKMMANVGLKVISLKRIKIGNLTLGNLPIGKYRELSKAEIDLLIKKEEL